MVTPRQQYIDAKTFKEFCVNQSMLIDVLNHRMTSIETSLSIIKNDVGWTKKLLWGIFGVIVGCVIAIVIKSAIGI